MAITYILDDLAGFLDAALPELTLGSNFFEGLLPNKPDTACSIYEYPGSPDEYLMGPSTLPAFSHPRIQTIVRSPDYEDGRVLIETVVRALETITNLAINGTMYYRIERVAAPSLLHRDALRRCFFVCNFAVTQEPGS